MSSHVQPGGTSKLLDFAAVTAAYRFPPARLGFSVGSGNSGLVVALEVFQTLGAARRTDARVKIRSAGDGQTCARNGGGRHGSFPLETLPVLNVCTRDILAVFDRSFDRIFRDVYGDV